MPLLRRNVERRSSVLDRLDGALFGFAGIAAIWLAYLLVKAGVRPGWPLLLLIVFWVVFTYLLLPRVHRILTRLYTPDYFIGRTRTGDGLLGDPVNLALHASEAQIHHAMLAAGWTRADDLSAISVRRMITSTVTRRSYTTAPVSPLLLFDRQQDFAYQQEVGGSTSKRHHVRFWRCPDGWLLPGGHHAGWLAAGTYDRAVGFSLFTLQVTHKIEQDTDIERDFIVTTVSDADPAVDVDVIENFSSGYHSRNGGGDRIETDGDLPVVDLTRVQAPEIDDAVRTDSRDKRPAQTVAGGVVALLRALAYTVLAVLFLTVPEVTARTIDAGASDYAGSEVRVIGIVLAVGLLFGAAIDVGLGLAVLAGRNWARILLMLFSVSTTVTIFVGDLRGSHLVTIANLPTVGGSVLVLITLSSHRAREYAARGRHVAKQVAPVPSPTTVTAGR